MNKRKIKIIGSLLILIPALLYVSGIVAQVIINVHAWKMAGSNYDTSPGIPSFNVTAVMTALFHNLVVLAAIFHVRIDDILVTDYAAI